MHDGRVLHRRTMKSICEEVCYYSPSPNEEWVSIQPMTTFDEVARDGVSTVHNRNRASFVVVAAAAAALVVVES